jgi:hypothetical protein
MGEGLAYGVVWLRLRCVGGDRVRVVCEEKARSVDPHEM